jgi:hypothetical protein
MGMEEQKYPWRAIDLYDRGVFTQLELVALIFTHLTQGNAWEFLKDCRKDVLTWLRERSCQLPADDDELGWAKTVHSPLPALLNRVARSWEG